jgi:hypothetical protein
VNQDLLALRRDLRALLSAWRRTLKADKRIAACHPQDSRSRSYLRGCADAQALCIQQLNTVMFSLSGGAPAHAGAPRFPRRRP